MVQIHVEVKVLDGKAPLLFAWWNREEQSVDTCLVTCPCQGFQLVDSEQPDASSESDRSGEQALNIGRLTRAFESSRVVSVLKGDLVPDICSIIVDDRNKRRGSTAKKKKRRRHMKENKKDDGLISQKESTTGNREAIGSSLRGITKDGSDNCADLKGTVILDVHESNGSGELSDIFKDAQTLSQDPPFHPSGTAHPSTSETLGNSVVPSHESSDRQILPLEQDAPTFPSYILADRLHQRTTGGNPSNITRNDCSTPMDYGETPRAIPIAIGVSIFSTLQEMIGQVQGGGGSEGDKEMSSLDTSAQLGDHEAPPTVNVADVDVDQGGGNPESGLKKKYKKRKDKYILCELCGKLLTDRSIKRHTEIMHIEGGRKKSHCCDRCPATFYHEPNLKRHIQGHEGVRYRCRFCDKSYVQDWNRKLHENVHFPKDQPVFVNKKGRTVRRGYVYPNRSVVCEVCGKTIKKTSLSVHMKTHSSKMFTCEICGATVRIISKYAHMLRHTHKKSHSCPHCTMMFYDKTALKLHIRTHTKERPIHCSYCDATFTRPGTRINHERLHTGERPYQCDLCQKSWRDRPTYMAHMKKHHPGTPVMYLRTRTPPTKTVDRDSIATAIESICQEIASA